MNAFLKSVAEYLYNTHQLHIQDVCLVFPNRRAGVFFSRYLAQLIDKPIWMPQIRTISELMKELSGYSSADPITLIFDLYHIYINEKKTDESFDEFYYWGEMLLNDFDDTDKYLVDTKQLFRNLADLKEIEKEFTLPEEQIEIISKFWKNIRAHESSRLKDDFISVWSVLQNIYTKFRELLHSKGIAYEGMMCRDICEKIKNYGTIKSEFQRFAIIGFNALNACEKELFQYLKKNDLAEFFWDFDDYYINHTWHEAGLFIRDNIKIFPSPPAFKNESDLTSPKNIEIISVPSDIGQTKLISEILNKWNFHKNEMTETALVLADEQLLIPAITSIPENASDVNVTMGYPLRLTPIYSFFEALVTLHRNAKQNNEGKVSFYHPDVTVLLNHPYVKVICEEEIKELSEYIVRYNRVFISYEELSKHDYLAQLFKIHANAEKFIDFLINAGAITARLLAQTCENENNNAFHSEYWFIFITALNRLKDLLIKESIVLEMPTLIRVLRKMVRGLSIPFKGEPLAGLQVMGMLETRALDFVNIIILSANEGILPKSDAATSFIPYNLRRGFNLPTIEHQDAVYAYYFYRLIQRAKNIALMYNSQGKNGAGEMSRFLFQLIYEPVFKVNKRGINFRVVLSEEKDITIPKTKYILDILYQYSNKSKESRYLTPTALNAYLECSLRFYFRYIAKIQPKENIIEDIEGSMFGKLLHNAMTKVYAPFLKKALSTHDFDNIIDNKSLIEDNILKAFAVEFFKKEDKKPELHGKSLVVKEVLRKYMNQLLEVDKKLAPLTLLELEKSFLTVFDIEVNGEKLQIKLGGIIDRIDKTSNVVRVVDYKTGKVTYKFENIDQLFEISGKKLNKEVLQILLYAYILTNDKEFRDSQISPCLYGMRDIFKKDFDCSIYQGKNEGVKHFDKVKETYLAGLKILLTEIFDPSVPFTKVTDNKFCEFCDYTGICHRS
jgi:hypothetical protein